MARYILNSAVLTAFGVYAYTPLAVEQASRLLHICDMAPAALVHHLPMLEAYPYGRSTHTSAVYVAPGSSRMRSAQTPAAFTRRIYHVSVP